MTQRFANLEGGSARLLRILEAMLEMQSRRLITLGKRDSKSRNARGRPELAAARPERLADRSRQFQLGPVNTRSAGGAFCSQFIVERRVRNRNAVVRFLAGARVRDLKSAAAHYGRALFMRKRRIGSLGRSYYKCRLLLRHLLN